MTKVNLIMSVVSMVVDGADLDCRRAVLPVLLLNERICKV